MLNFLKKLLGKNKNIKFIEQKEDKKFLDEFNTLAEEIKFLIVISSVLWIQEDKFQKRLKKIYYEVDKLDKFVKHKAYLKLSEEKKNDLLKALKFSKAELLKTIESAPCPTDVIQ